MKLKILLPVLVLHLLFSVEQLSAEPKTTWIQTPIKSGPFEYAGLLSYDGTSMVALSLPDIESIKSKMTAAAVELEGSPLKPTTKIPPRARDSPESCLDSKRGPVVLKVISSVLSGVAMGIVTGYFMAKRPDT